MHNKSVSKKTAGPQAKKCPKPNIKALPTKPRSFTPSGTLEETNYGGNRRSSSY